MRVGRHTTEPNQTRGTVQLNAVHGRAAPAARTMPYSTRLLRHHTRAALGTYLGSRTRFRRRGG
eukprot:1454237-Rhodomonas_salina.2